MVTIIMESLFAVSAGVLLYALWFFALDCFLFFLRRIVLPHSRSSVVRSTDHGFLQSVVDTYSYYDRADCYYGDQECRMHRYYMLMIFSL